MNKEWSQVSSLTGLTGIKSLKSLINNNPMLMGLY